MDWKKLISSRAPILPSLKRTAVVCRDAALGTGGSQCGEDRWMADFLWGSGIKPNDVRYIEVGANQPSQLSNTWLFYQRGASGILIEPDPRCTQLLRRWRPRDVVLESMAGASGVGVLHLHRHTTMNSGRSLGEFEIGRSFVPIIRLDDAWAFARKELGWADVDVLSVDTEGGEMEILESGSILLQSTRLVCLEHHGHPHLLRQFQGVLGACFEAVLETPLNVIFRRLV
jgi:FkbM family methyltransferase